MRARDVMVRAVVTTSPDTTVEKLARLMINLRISGVPVLDGDGRLVGIVTEGDLLRRAETGTERHRSRWSELFSSNSRLAAEYIKSHAKRVADIMTREVVSIDEMATLAEIADLLETKQIKRVPVVHDGRIVGIVSRADLLQVLASGGVKTADEDRDRTIRDQLLTKLRSQKWADASEGRVVVSDGVVHFWGIVGSEAERKALRVAAENTPGVLGIEDHTIL
jgi:CBS domain-containing protein